MSYNVNLVEIANELGFDVEDVESILDIFLESSKDSLDTIKLGLDTNNFDIIVQSAHAIKGSSGNLRLKEISLQAKELEVLGKDSDFAACQEKYEQISNLIANIQTN